MAGQLSPDDRLSRLRRTGLIALALSVVALTLAAFWALRSRGAPTVRCVVRPEVSVQGVAAGSAVRLSGVVVGQVVRLGLWSDPANGQVRPELVLALDAGHDSPLRDVPACVREGLRARFTPVNPASGFLDVDLLWLPGSPRRVATSDPEELPWQAGAGQEAVARVMPVVRRLATEDLRAHVAALVERLGVVEARVAEGPRAAASLADRAARLRAALARIEGATGPDGVADLQVRLADLREGLRVAEATLDSLDRDLVAWPGPVGESLRSFSASCRASAARLRREVSSGAPR